MSPIPGRNALNTALSLLVAAALAGCDPGTASTAPGSASGSADAAPPKPRAAIPVPAPREWTPAELASIEKRFGETQVRSSGLRFTVTQPPASPPARPENGQRLVVHYHGTFLDGRVFDSSVQRNAPFRFRVGRGEVIEGWDEAFLDMAVGEKRTIIVPWWLAYGESGRPPVIPPRAALVFEVELLEIRS